jgi:hypothetical protein
MNSTNWRELILDDKNFDSTVVYDYDKLLKHLDSIKSSLDNINPYDFMSASFEMTKAFSMLGSALSMGFSDITTKVQLWRDLVKTYYNEESFNSLQDIMGKEIELKLHMCNGDNNRSNGFGKTTQYYLYVSGTRTLLRLNWFFDFISTIFKNILNSKDVFSTCIKNAYYEVLAPHHSWLVKQSVGMALNFAGSKREPALTAFFGI